MILPSHLKVYLASGVTDLRKSISGLSTLVDASLGLDLFSGSLFVFCNRNRQLIKVLYWDHNGFCLWQKRLECEEVVELTQRQLEWLLQGLDFSQITAHQPLDYCYVA